MCEFELNGRVTRVPAAAIGTTLLDFLRGTGLTGAKEGCAEGECGACAVAIRVGGGRGSEYRAINSCLVLLPMVAGREVYTVEAIADAGTLAPVQRALAAAGGSQCGYCTPGFVVSLFTEYYRPGREGPCDPRALEGNLCRCTGYRPIAEAARALGSAPPDAFTERLRRPAPPLREVSFDDFARPSTVDACVDLLRDHPDATLVAGGTDLVVERNLRQRRWPRLVSVEAIDELRGFDITPEYVRIGAGLPLADLLPHWPDAPEAVREWVARFASPLIRNRATFGGNLATASPVGDGAPLLLALDASVEIAGPAPSAGAAWRRTIPLSAFFTGYRRTALLPGELIVAVRIPRPLPAVLRFYKVTKRRLDDISTVAAAVALDLHAGVVGRARVAFGGVAATPLRVTDAESVIEGSPLSRSTMTRVQAVLDRTLAPLSDHRGSRDYRRAVCSSLIEKCWSEVRP